MSSFRSRIVMVASPCGKSNLVLRQMGFTQFWAG
jgi:hypothetical protein